MRARHSTTSRSAAVVLGAVVIADALNAAATAAYLAVIEHAGRYRRREEYRPLEDLAGCVWQAALEAGVEAARRSEE